jgi:hypothetical protein
LYTCDKSPFLKHNQLAHLLKLVLTSFVLSKLFNVDEKTKVDIHYKIGYTNGRFFKHCLDKQHLKQALIHPSM